MIVLVSWIRVSGLFTVAGPRSFGIDLSDAGEVVCFVKITINTVETTRVRLSDEELFNDSVEATTDYYHEV